MGDDSGAAEGYKMLTEWINATMRQARYEILEDGTDDGEIPGLQGVYANERTLGATRTALQRVLEDWLLFRLVYGFPIPAIGGIELTTTGIAGLSGPSMGD